MIFGSFQLIIDGLNVVVVEIVQQLETQVRPRVRSLCDGGLDVALLNELERRFIPIHRNDLHLPDFRRFLHCYVATQPVGVCTHTLYGPPLTLLASS